MKANLALALAIFCTVSAALPAMNMFRDPHSYGQGTVDDVAPPKYETAWFETKLDHFNFDVNNTFKMRYLYSWEFFENSAEKPGPIFLYTGNEGSIETFWNNSGYWTNVLAPKFGAILLFPEHRYYGETLPFGKDSLTPENIKYLSTEQALADYAIFVEAFKRENGLENSPVIAFGGSYGGMLSGWFRMKYPHVVDGALAASAPLIMYQNITSPYAFNEVVTNDFKNAKEGCASLFREGFMELTSLRTQSQYYDSVSEELNLCAAVKAPEDIDGIYNWISGAMGNMAMIDYPYPTNFLAPVPASPVTAACEALIKTANAEGNVAENSYAALMQRIFNKAGSNTSDLPKANILKGMIAAVNIFYDYEGKTTCNDMGNSGTPTLGTDAWDYQACTEQVLPIASNGKTDFFWPQLWDLKEYSKQCEAQWGTPSRPFWVPQHFGGWDYQRDFASYSNIIFSQGELDPWHIGGVTETIKGGKDLISFVMRGSAHHLDLRYPNDADPVDVKHGRELETEYVAKWIAEAVERNLRND